MSNEPIVWGKTFICKRCGNVAQQKSRLKIAASATQGDAYIGEFCEYCVPGSMLGAFAAMALSSEQEQEQVQP